jgi:hypothetical protein
MRRPDGRNKEKEKGEVRGGDGGSRGGEGKKGCKRGKTREERLKKKYTFCF